ncbi:MAG: hypothetical protein E7045_00590 [Lentisphaerae bacterium]|nr:hypothetical protein [Lentisphaerota bacterium]
MKVKIFSLPLVVMCAVLCLFGCGNNDGVWYPVEGGFINLKNVKEITTEFSLVLDPNSTLNPIDLVNTPIQTINKISTKAIIKQPITKENIDKAKKIVEENEFSNVKYSAFIIFDDQEIKLPKMEKFESKEDVLDMLDDWLDSVEELEDFIL